jgi:hypothetical protein
MRLMECNEPGLHTASLAIFWRIDEALESSAGFSSNQHIKAVSKMQIPQGMFVASHCI